MSASSRHCAASSVERLDPCAGMLRRMSPARHSTAPARLASSAESDLHAASISGSNALCVSAMSRQRGRADPAVAASRAASCRRSTCSAAPLRPKSVRRRRHGQPGRQMQQVGVMVAAGAFDRRPPTRRLPRPPPVTAVSSVGDDGQPRQQTMGGGERRRGLLAGLQFDARSCAARRHRRAARRFRGRRPSKHAQRVAQAAEHSRRQDARLRSIRDSRCPAPAGSPPDCRYRPSKHSADAEARASACRTS